MSATASPTCAVPTSVTRSVAAASNRPPRSSSIVRSLSGANFPRASAIAAQRSWTFGVPSILRSVSIASEFALAIAAARSRVASDRPSPDPTR
jgi:hypothetical protein